MRTNPSTISLQRSALRSFDRIPQRRAKARGGRRTFLSRILALFRLWQERARTRRQLRELNERELFRHRSDGCPIGGRKAVLALARPKQSSRRRPLAKGITMATVELHHGALTECRRPSTAVDAPGVEAQTIARRVRAAGSSFYWAIGLLPAPRRHSMYALYAFCREVNDIAGSETTSSLKRALLAAWRSEIALLYAGRPRHHVTRALQEAVQQYGLRCDDFLAVIDGMEMDSQRDIRAPSLAELDLYCARVAVAIGLLSMRILGVTTPAGERVAGALGRAIRLTNILRDLTEDGARHRLYLPRELLLAHGIVATMPSYVLAQPALPAVCQDLARLAENHY
jgi:presqualene diphosphate synthase